MEAPVDGDRQEVHVEEGLTELLRPAFDALGGDGLVVRNFKHLGEEERRKHVDPVGDVVRCIVPGVVDEVLQHAVDEAIVKEFTIFEAITIRVNDCDGVRRIPGRVHEGHSIRRRRR